MTDTRYIVPRAGALVRHPATRKPVPAEGMHVEWSVHWERRLADGDIQIGEPPAPPKAKKAAAPKE